MSDDPTPVVAWCREVTVVVSVPGCSERLVRVPVAVSEDYSTVSGSFALTPEEAGVLATAPPLPARRAPGGHAL